MSVSLVPPLPPEVIFLMNPKYRFSFSNPRTIKVQTIGKTTRIQPKIFGAKIFAEEANAKVQNSLKIGSNLTDPVTFNTYVFVQSITSRFYLFLSFHTLLSLHSPLISFHFISHAPVRLYQCCGFESGSARIHIHLVVLDPDPGYGN
jgi:hypothetical protein